MEAFDVIIIGAGPNGLTCANYLQRAGLSTLLLEKKHECGGGMYTDDFSSPFRYNLHAIYMMMGEIMPAYKDLELYNYPVQFIYPEVQGAFVTKDGRSMVYYYDDERTLAEMKKWAPEDEPALRKLFADFKFMCDGNLIPATYGPPMPALELIMMSDKQPEGAAVSELSQITPIELIERYGIKNPLVKGSLLYLACRWGLKPDVTGATFMVPVYVRLMTKASLVKGGTHSLSAGLYNALGKAGGKILDWSEVDKIITQNNRAIGVHLKDGREFKANKAVVSTMDPQTTFLKMLDKDVVSRDLRTAVRQWAWEDWSWFTMHLGIKGGPPDFKAAQSNPDVNKALNVYMGYESAEDVLAYVHGFKDGKPATPKSGVLTTVSLHDPTQVASGPYSVGKYGPLHTLRYENWNCYQPEGQDWDDIRLKYAADAIESLGEYAPNLKDARVLFRFADSPKDCERRLVNMVKGSIKHGAYLTTQMGFTRPNDQCSFYNTPIEGLYLGGASSYPGGMVLLASGYNCAGKIVRDLGANKWWTEPEMVVEAQSKKIMATWEILKKKGLLPDYADK